MKPVKPLHDYHLQPTFHVSQINISSASLKKEGLESLRNKGPQANSENDVDVRAAAAMCQYAYAFLNERKKPLILIDGWEQMKDTEVDELIGSGFHKKLQNKSNGFSSMLFKKQANGTKYYAYCTKGTDMTSIKDWGNNLSQAFLFGISSQYSFSVSNAKRIDTAIGNKAVLWFIGHSLGGGLASNNSLVTGRHAITFNAAGLNPFRVNATLALNNWKDLFHPIKRNNRVHAFVLEGEMLNTLSWWIGQTAYGDTKTIKMRQKGIGSGDRHSLSTILKNWGMKYE